MRKTIATRRIATAVIGGTLALGLAACSSDDDTQDDATEDVSVEDDAEDVADEDEDEIVVDDAADDDTEDADEDDEAADDAEASEGSGDYTAASWATPITTPGDEIATIEGDNFLVEIFQVDVTPSPKDGMLADPDTNTPLLAEGDDIVFVNYVVTNTSDEAIELGSSLAAMDATYADWEYMQGMDSITDHDLWDEMDVNTTAVGEHSEEGVYSLGAGESYSLGDNFFYKTDAPVIFEARVTPVDDEGDLDHDLRQEVAAEATLN